MDLTVLIPAHNEQDYIEACISSLKSLPANHNLTILVADNGSRDKTAQYARAQGAHVYSVKKRGKGEALNELARHVSRQSQYVIVIDADVGNTASEIIAVLNACIEQHADLAIASFAPSSHAKGFGFVVGCAQQALAKSSMRTWQSPLSGQRVYTARAFFDVLPFAHGYGVEIISTLRALDQGLHVIECPTQMTHRYTSWKCLDILHRLHQYLDIRRALFRYYNNKKSSTVSYNTQDDL